MMRSIARHWYVIAVMASAAASFGAEPVVRVEAEPVDPGIAQLSVGDLIIRLAQENEIVTWSENEKGHLVNSTLNVPAQARGFLPLGVVPDWERNMKRPVKSPTMVELVRRGLDALPVLLANLDNQRSTLIVQRGPDIGMVSFADHYDARHRDPLRQPPGVNSVQSDGVDTLSPHDAYVYRVGDLCYFAATNIVNRHPSPRLGRHSIRGRVIDSPLRYPALAAAMRTDWSGLTPRDHEDSLRFDALEVTPEGERGSRSSGGLQRLLYYYPAAGRAVAEELLARQAAQTDPLRWLAETYALMSDLGAFQWDGLDDQVLAVLERSVQLPDLNGELTLICARRLAGRGYDAKLRQLLEALIARNEQLSASAGFDQTQRRIRLEANVAYREFLAELKS
jgi:hypothetical protein